MFSGTYTAIVTPFRDGRIDEPALRDLVDFQIENGVDGIVPTGSTGEAATLDNDEHLRVIQIVIEQAKGRCRIVAGTGSNSTREAVELSQQAAAAGADGILLASPYYNKPTQEGIYRHFQAITQAVNCPIMLYNVPGRTASEIGVETCSRLAHDFPKIVSIKEAGGSCERVSALRNVLPPDFTILSGDDPLTLPFLALGAVGVVSVASNIVPGPIKQLVDSFRAGRVTEALDLHLFYSPLFKDLFIESNPIPIKAALALTGRIQAEYRLPLCPISASHLESLKNTLRKTKVI